MNLVHAAGKHRARDSVLHHRVSVAAAEGAAEFRFDSQCAAGVGKMDCHLRVRFQMEGFDMEAVCERKLCPRLFDSRLKHGTDIFQGLHCLFMAVAADLATAGAEFRHGIHNRTARNQAHIQGCFLIHVPQL